MFYVNAGYGIEIDDTERFGAVELKIESEL